MPCFLSIAELWSRLRANFAAMRAALEPLHTMPAAEARRMRAWLGALEALARQIFLLEALELAPAFAKAPRPVVQLVQPSERRAPAKRAQRMPGFRLWPRRRPGPRARLLGPPTLVREIWRERERAAQIARLKAAKRKSRFVRWADRLDALERAIAAPKAHVRRLARKLARMPRLAIAIVARRAPRSPRADQQAIRHGAFLAFGRVRAHLDALDSS